MTAPDLGSLFVRATLDEQSRIAALCVEGPPVPGGFRKRANLSARFLKFADVDGAPECLADRRLDINRRKSMQTAIKRRTNVCRNRSESVQVTHTEVGRAQAAVREFERCMDYQANWLTLYEVGRQQPHNFALPEVVDPPDIEASVTRAKCNKKRNSTDIAACMIADGWELLD
jgi:hypothetical protein